MLTQGARGLVRRRSLLHPGDGDQRRKPPVREPHSYCRLPGFGFCSIFFVSWNDAETKSVNFWQKQTCKLFITTCFTIGHLNNSMKIHCLYYIYILIRFQVCIIYLLFHRFHVCMLRHIFYVVFAKPKGKRTYTDRLTAAHTFYILYAPYFQNRIFLFQKVPHTPRPN